MASAVWRPDVRGFSGRVVEISPCSGVTTTKTYEIGGVEMLITEGIKAIQPSAVIIWPVCKFHLLRVHV